MMQPVEDSHDRTVRWRQLVDLSSRPHDEIDPALLDAALTMVRSGVRAVPKAVRSATARSIAGRAAGVPRAGGAAGAWWRTAWRGCASSK